MKQLNDSPCIQSVQQRVSEILWGYSTYQSKMKIIKNDKIAFEASLLGLTSWTYATANAYY